MSAQEYYEDPNQWGNYQNITLEQIVNDFMGTGDPDDYTSTISRHQVLFQARRAIQELYFDVMHDNRAISLEIDSHLTIPVPPDYIDYIRISWVDENGLLHPMAMNVNKASAKTYLQDHAYEILFDSDGCVITDSSIVASAKDSLVDGEKQRSKLSEGCCHYAFVPNANFSNVYANGSFVIDKQSGVIQFSSNIESKSIVLEYVSDGLFLGCTGKDDGQITIHKFARTAVMNFIYFESIARRRNVPANEKQRARKEYYNSRRVAKRRLNGMKIAEILQAFRGESKWIKN